MFSDNQVLPNEIHDLPDDLAKRMNVSFIVLSTAQKAPGIIERATAIAPLAPGPWLQVVSSPCCLDGAPARPDICG